MAEMSSSSEKKETTGFVHSTPRTILQSRQRGWDEARHAAVTDIKHNLIEVDIDDFCDHYLLYQPSEDVLKSCIKQLQQDLHINADGTWSGFGIRRGSEQETYPLQKLANDVFSAYPVDGRPPRTCEFKSRPCHVTKSETEGSSFESDTVCKLLILSVLALNQGQRVKEKDWYSADVVVNVEYKLQLVDTFENRCQLIGGAAHYMFNDPCRLFMYSLSIKDDHVHLWYFSRSHSARSMVFSARKDVCPLLRFIIAMLFGTPEQLGFDPSVTRKRDNSRNLYYVYKVNGHCYRTLGKPIFHYHAPTISGRATRCWLVQECTKDGEVSYGAEKYVLQDYWSQEHCTELGIPKAMYKRFDELKEHVSIEIESSVSTPDAPTSAPKSLVSIPVSGFESPPSVPVSTPNSPPSVPEPLPVLLPLADTLPCDETDRQVILNALTNYESYFIADPDQEVLTQTIPDVCSEWDSCCLGQHYIKRPPSKAFGSSQTAHDGQLNTPPARVYKPIGDLTDVGDITQTLRDWVIALHLLYLIGYIHCDISISNVFYDSDTRKGRLSGLEYVRAFHRKDVATDVKTGTPAFMAVDIRENENVMWAEFDRPNTVLHTYLHDLESVFWLTTWMFSNRYTECPPDIKAIKAHERDIHEMFSDQSSAKIRRTVMRNEDGIELMRALLSYTLSSAGIEAIFRFHADLRSNYYAMCRVKHIEDDKMYRNAFTQAKKSFNIIKAQCAERIHRVHNVPENSVSQSDDAAEHKETST
ncbi:hypothetical protein K435DRAFT_871414 [Dendrothele bispora CBS 962.96]|uniref:Fungal-type protein kinase domain-containing protein n=1 Tax=Dendrothele bispora (strain CBS 962.96) TaxID=1314807 RepID=A0A4V4HCI1_DENBC|nr:hypothetical protein K435DRAFT_871414 [Dendrothele bispora CBS 962.96]